MAITDALAAYGQARPSIDQADLTGRGNTLTPSFPTTTSTNLVYVMGSSSGHFTDGAFCRYGKWDRIITSGERTTLYNSGAGQLLSGISGGSLNDYRHYYNFNGSSDLSDTAGNGPTFTAVASPTTDTGPGGSNSSISFNGSTQYLNAVDNNVFDTPVLNSDGTGGQCTVAFWYRPDATANGTNIDYIVGKYLDAAGVDLERLFYYRHASGDRLFHYDQGHATSDPKLAVVKCDTFGTPTAGTWHLVIIEIDKQANTVTVRIRPSGGSETAKTVSDIFVPSIPGTLSRGFKFISSFTFTGADDGRAAVKYLSRTVGANADLNCGDYTRSGFLWVKLNSLATGESQQHIYGYWEEPGGKIGTSIDWYNTSSGRYYLQVSDFGGTNFALPFVAMTDTNLHSIYWEVTVNGGTRNCKIRIDDTTESTASIGFALVESSNPIRLGSIHFNIADDQYEAGNSRQAVAEVKVQGVWGHALSSAEITQLHGLGASVDYPYSLDYPIAAIVAYQKAVQRRRRLVNYY